MTENYDQYALYFHADLRVEVGIPVSREEVFRDWAVVKEFYDDLIMVELSRDQLPRRVTVAYGSILDIGVWRGQEVYTCRAIVAEKIGSKILRMRLLGAVTLRDRRQFYRLNAALRIRYSIPDADTTAGALERDWEDRRRQEIDAFRIRMGECDEALRNFLIRPREQTGKDSPVWHDRPDIRGVIGGGGIGFRMHRKLQPGELVRLELHLPLYPFRIVHAIGEVVYVLDPVLPSGAKEPVFHTGMRFYRIDERDRDHIVEFISQVELERLREITDRRQPREVDEQRLEEDVKKAKGRELLRNVLVVVVFLIAVYLLIIFLVSYKSTHGDNEIGREFRDSLSR